MNRVLENRTVVVERRQGEGEVDGLVALVLDRFGPIIEAGGHFPLEPV